MTSLLCKIVIPNFILTKGYSLSPKQSAVPQLINHESISFWSRVSKTKKSKNQDPDASENSVILIGPSKCEDSKCPKKRKMHPKPDAKLLAFKKIRCVKRRKLFLLRRKFGQSKWSFIKQIFVGPSAKTLKKIPDDFQIPAKDPCTVITAVARCAYPPRCQHPSLDLQPVSPEAFKIPKAVLYQIMVKDHEKKQHDCETPDAEKKEGETDPHLDEGCESLTHEPKEFWLPYEELRPVTTDRRVFTCHKGIRWKDVGRPCTKDCNYCNTLLAHLKSKSECPIHEDIYPEEKSSKEALNRCPSKTCP